MNSESNTPKPDTKVKVNKRVPKALQGMGGMIHGARDFAPLGYYKRQKSCSQAPGVPLALGTDSAIGDQGSLDDESESDNPTEGDNGPGTVEAPERVRVPPYQHISPGHRQDGDHDVLRSIGQLGPRAWNIGSSGPAEGHVEMAGRLNRGTGSIPPNQHRGLDNLHARAHGSFNMHATPAVRQFSQRTESRGFETTPQYQQWIMSANQPQSGQMRTQSVNVAASGSPAAPLYSETYPAEQPQPRMEAYVPSTSMGQGSFGVHGHPQSGAQGHPQQAFMHGHAAEWAASQAFGLRSSGSTSQYAPYGQHYPPQLPLSTNHWGRPGTEIRLGQTVHGFAGGSFEGGVGTNEVHSYVEGHPGGPDTRVPCAQGPYIHPVGSRGFDPSLLAGLAELTKEDEKKPYETPI